jgi:hypothetical protein
MSEVPEHPAHQIKRELESAMEHLRVRCTGHARHINVDASEHVGAALALVPEVFKWEQQHGGR